MEEFPHKFCGGTEMMNDRRQADIKRFGRLDTWIVGIQYYEGAKTAENQEVVFECDPDNPFDSNAVAVFTTSGIQIGHLPRYDAEYFSPLILKGAIALKGRAGESERRDRLPLALEVLATSKVSEVLVRDVGDDWRAIYHNLFIELWERLPNYQSATLCEFRDIFRPVAHEKSLFPKTQFLYRMLKAHIADLKEQEQQNLRDQVFAAVREMDFAPVMGWPELTVIPLDAIADGSKEKPPPPEAETITTLALPRDKLPDVLRMLPSRCPYPTGARGAVLLVYGEWESLEWFDSAECAQVYWYQMILSGIKTAFEQSSLSPPSDIITSESVKAHILEALQSAEYTLDEGNEEDEAGVTRVFISTGSRAGHALFREGHLTRLKFHEAAPVIVCEDTLPDLVDSPPRRVFRE